MSFVSACLAFILGLSCQVSEFRAACLAAGLFSGEVLLSRVEEDRPGPTANHQEAAPAVRFLGTDDHGWSVAETAHFRIHHHAARLLVRQVARVAERTRSAVDRRWFGGRSSRWAGKCDLYLHATGAEYHQETGAPARSPGHSSFRIEDGEVIGRRIDLRCDDPNMLPAVLPHETTHTVIAGSFGDGPVPRWADEGMAVLSEPRAQIDHHLRRLPDHRLARELFSLKQLLEMPDYPPDPRHIGAFYAQSVSLVDFLVREKGPRVFTRFLTDGLRNGYGVALRRHYGWRGFAELERHWSAHAFDAVSARE